jgi:hypothetical protein
MVATQNVPLHRLVAEYLRSRRGSRLTVAEISRGLTELHSDRFAEKARGLGSQAALVDQLTREIYAQRGGILLKHPDIATDSSKSPIKFFIEGLDEAESVHTAGPEAKPNTPQVAVSRDEPAEEQSEHALYEPLQQYLSESLGIVSRRIRESTSANRRGKHGNKWLHPDIVGMLAPGQDWDDVVRQCSMAMPTRKAKVISIEVKIRLSSGTVRESFFQAVSNSLWANRAYLASTEVKGEDTLSELTTLCSLHGIGYINLDPENPSESRVLIPAREREEVDWASANRIAVENADFREFLRHVLNYLQTGHVVGKLWRP